MKNATTPVRTSGNVLMQLDLYKNHTTWMFDDPAQQILAEPFVLGMSEIITRRIIPVLYDSINTTYKYI